MVFEDKLPCQFVEQASELDVGTAAEGSIFSGTLVVVL